jgi:hypothetical protein
MDSSWTAEPDPWTVREREIRERLDGFADHRLRPEGVAAMLRDAMARYEQLLGALAVRRAETLCEASELLRRVGHPAAAELLDSQLLLDMLTQASGRPLPRSITVRIWEGLAQLLPDGAQQLGEGFIRDFLGEEPGTGGSVLAAAPE